MMLLFRVSKNMLAQKNSVWSHILYFLNNCQYNVIHWFVFFQLKESRDDLVNNSDNAYF